MLRYYCNPTDAGGLVLSVRVEHHTDDYPDLKAAARRHWAQPHMRSGRLDFVAWDVEDPRIPLEARRRYREEFANELRRVEGALFHGKDARSQRDNTSRVT